MYDSFQFYNKHYIDTRENGAIISVWSDGPHQEKDTTYAICINEKGGYQFRLILDGQLTEENPPIFGMDGIPIYKWDGSQVVPRTTEEIKADRKSIPSPPPTDLERMEAQITYTAMKTNTLLGV